MFLTPASPWAPRWRGRTGPYIPAAMWKTPLTAPPSAPRLAVVGNSADYCWPCGACRQMLYEFAPDLEVLVARQDHTFVKYTLRQLLPQGFGPDSLA